MAAIPFEDILGDKSQFQLDPTEFQKSQQLLGRGNYGEVWAALWTRKDMEKPIKVAMKIIKNSKSLSSSELQMQEQLIQNELKVLSHIGEHKYIVHLVGALENCIITEFCEFGSLEDFLSKKSSGKLFMDEMDRNYIRPEFTATKYVAQRNTSWPAGYKDRRQQGKVTTSDLLAFCYQIVIGITFLQDKKVLHRDLTLRNILLTADFIVKIADFGLSRITNVNGAYFVTSRMTELPIESPPETILHFGGAVSLKADWWALGVLFWTIFHLGTKKPLLEETRELMKKDGKVLSRPIFAPYEMYALMLDLWILDPEDRADLRECQTKIKRQLKSSCPPLVNELMDFDTEIRQQQEQQEAEEQLKADHSQAEVILANEPLVRKLSAEKNQSSSRAESLTAEYIRIEKESLSRKNRTYLFSKTAGGKRIAEHKGKLLCGFSLITLLLIALLIWISWKFIFQKGNDRYDGEQLNNGDPAQKELDAPQSEEEAFNWFIRAAERGNAIPQFNLGVMYEEGRGIPVSTEDAIKWYRKAAEQGSALAQNRLGLMYENGRGVNQSDEEAVKWYTKAAELGNAQAQSRLGTMYQSGTGVNQSNEEAVKWFGKAADQGSANAQYELGAMYYYGEGIPRSYEEALKWFRKAADQGNAQGQNGLGIMYQYGRGVNQSHEEAIKWCRKAAEQGDANSQYNLGFLYASAQGINGSDEEAVTWFRKAAEQGFANAQYKLGLMYQSGRGVNQSDEEALEWLIKAAEQGRGQSNLGLMYEKGQGVPQSDEEAVKWYRKAAERGNVQGQFNLANMYRDGRGVPESEEEALKWYNKAAEQGHRKAMVVIELMAHLKEYESN